MREEKPRNLALKLLNRVNSGDRYSGNYTDDLFQNHPYLDNRDRAALYMGKAFAKDVRHRKEVEK